MRPLIIGGLFSDVTRSVFQWSRVSVIQTREETTHDRQSVYSTLAIEFLEDFITDEEEAE
jgi:hypothetical protein